MAARGTELLGKVQSLLTLVEIGLLCALAIGVFAAADQFDYGVLQAAADQVDGEAGCRRARVPPGGRRLHGVQHVLHQGFTRFGATLRHNWCPGTARSRENANIIREADVTDAVRQNICATQQMKSRISAQVSPIDVVQM